MNYKELDQRLNEADNNVLSILVILLDIKEEYPSIFKEAVTLNTSLGFIAKALLKLNKPIEYIKWELRLIDSKRFSEISDDTANIISSQKFLDLYGSILP